MVNNLESYSFNDTVGYYERLCKYGLFNYESRIIRKYFPADSLVLDIGCGVGRTTNAMKEIGYKVVGVDYSKKMIDAAIQLNSEVKYCVQDVRRMKFTDDMFDCAMFSFNGLMLLESYEDRKMALLEICRVLKKEGVLFFTTPFLDNKICGHYWKNKINKFNKDISHFSMVELMELGDEIVEEDSVKFKIHIPFIREIQTVLYECNYDIIFEGRRLDYFGEEKIEDELDDNYLWVVVKKNV